MNKRATVLSPCRQYRYVLWREWDMFNPAYAVIIGLNPSTADEHADDPTIRRCIDFATRWGYGALCMVNLFAWRATKPTEMMSVPQPVGPENDDHLQLVGAGASVIVAAWGNHGVHMNRDREVKAMFAGRLKALKLSSAGHPWHPLYLKAELVPQPFG